MEATETKVRSYAEAVEITVNWWVEKSFKTPLNQNNGDDSDSGGMIFMLMNLASQKSNESATPQKIEKFKSKLTEILLIAENKRGYEQDCSVDYHPSKPLSDACDYAEINSMALPCKTFTSINSKNQVVGRFQYAGEWFTI